MDNTEVFELTLDHQMQPQNYGLFSSLAKAEEYLKETLHVDIEKKSVYWGGGRVIYGDYVITRKVVS